jgi:8-oxo-dGTP diphosphatase
MGSDEPATNLTDYPRPNVAVDVVLLTICDGRLLTLLTRRPSQGIGALWSLPGGFVRPGESADDAAARVLTNKVGLEDLFLEQLYTFSAPERDPRGWVMSVAYYALVPWETLARASRLGDEPDAKLFELGVAWAGEAGGPAVVKDGTGKPLALAFDHADILGMAVLRLRGKIWYKPVAFETVPAQFSLGELQTVYETILGRHLNKSAFRRRLLASGLIAPTGSKRPAGGAAFRPPALYRFVPAEPAEQE